MFETFIKATSDYTDREHHVPAPMIRRSFYLDFSPKIANIRICTPGFYELFINGTKLTKGFLAPYISNPDQLLCYDEYEIANYLNEGKNSIGMILGNGFGNQSVYHWDFGDASFRSAPSVALELTAENGNKSFELKSDEGFKTYPSPIIYDMYRFGTQYDARLEIDGWCTPDFDDSYWKNVIIAERPKGEIVKCTAEAITLQKEITPISIKKQDSFCYLKTAFRGGEDVEFTRAKGGYVYDFGISHSGVCKLTIKGKRGQKVTLRHAERLSDDGSFNINSVYTYAPDYADFVPNFQTDVYILRSEGEETFIPSFTYHGFRYVYVEGITDEQATRELLTLEVFNSNLTPRSSFTCSDMTLNKLYEMAINADLSNFHYFPTDCPHREKNGWTGDAAASAEQMLLSFDCKESFKLWLNSMRHAQRDDGMLPGIVPTTGWGFKWGNGPAWDIACVNIPYYVYKYDKDISILKDNAHMIYKYLRYISSRRDEHGLVHIGLGDWVQPRKVGSRFRAPLVLTDSVTVYEIAKKSSFIFDILGLDEEKRYADSLAYEMRREIRSQLIDKSTMTALGACQTSQALLLYHGIFNEDERERAYARLIEIIEEDGYHSICGMIGLRVIFDVLIDGGFIDIALKMITRKDPPSYGFMIENGATALCEALEENGVQESQNHHFLGDIIRVFISRLAGLNINPNLDDNNSLVFSPTLTETLDHAFGEYDFAEGLAYGGWKRENGLVTGFITVPDGVSGRFEYKGISMPLRSGYNEFIL